MTGSPEMILTPKISKMSKMMSEKLPQVAVRQIRVHNNVDMVCTGSGYSGSARQRNVQGVHLPPRWTLCLCREPQGSKLHTKELRKG